MSELTRTHTAHLPGHMCAEVYVKSCVCGCQREYDVYDLPLAVMAHVGVSTSVLMSI